MRADARTVTFNWKDNRIKGEKHYKCMAIQTDEFIRRFLLHVLPAGFHRSRHYGVLSNNVKADELALARKTPDVEPIPGPIQDSVEEPPVFVCRECGEAMVIVSLVSRSFKARAPPR